MTCGPNVALYFCIAHELRMAFPFLSGWKKIFCEVKTFCVKHFMKNTRFKFQCPPKIKFCWNTYSFVHICLKPKQQSWIVVTHHMTHKAPNIWHLTLYRKLVDPCHRMWQDLFAEEHCNDTFLEWAFPQRWRPKDSFDWQWFGARVTSLLLPQLAYLQNGENKTAPLCAVLRLLFWERPAWKAGPWLASGNLDFGGVPAVSITGKHGSLCLSS